MYMYMYCVKGVLCTCTCSLTSVIHIWCNDCNVYMYNVHVAFWEGKGGNVYIGRKEEGMSTRLSLITLIEC